MRFLARILELFSHQREVSRLSEQVRTLTEDCDRLRNIHAGSERHFQQIVEVLTQIAMRDPHVTDSQRALIAKSLSKNDDWLKAVMEIAALDPAAAGLERSLLGNFKWIVAGRFEMHEAIVNLLSRTEFRIADVGAQLLDSQDHVYSPLARNFPCRVIGFEPLREELEKRSVSDAEAIMLPYFIGNGKAQKFYETAFNPASSNFEPDFAFLGQFHALDAMLQVVNTSEVESHRMDDIEHLRDIDFLKLDVQGSELACLQGGEEALKNVVVVDVEIEFVQLYKKQPVQHEVDMFLKEHGFTFIDYRDPGYLTYAEHPAGYGGSRLGWADAVYFKSDPEIEALDPDKILKAAAIAHYVYAYWDVAAHLFGIYDRRSGTETLSLYQAQLRQKIFSFAD